MSLSLSNILQKNADYLKRSAAHQPVAVFVGGTSGIGEHTAYAFAKYTHQPTIYIVGRNVEAGKHVVSKLKEINPDPLAKFTFLQSDLTLISEADKLSDIIKQHESKINLLFLSPGFMTMSGRQETKEGIDAKLAVHYYGRWRVVEKLLPLLLKASEGEFGANNSTNARVVSVLGPGDEGPIKEDDLDLKHNYSLLNFNRHIIEFTSLAVTRFGEKYPSVGFVHAHPGLVSTGILREFPWYIKTLLTPALWFFKSPKDAGEHLFYVSTDSQYSTGGHLLSASLKSVNEKPQNSGYLSKELQEKVWHHTLDIFKQAEEINKPPS